MVAVGMVVFIWFASGLTLLLARVEEQPSWRSLAAAGSALAFVAVGLNGVWEAAAYRGGKLPPELAVYAFDLGNIEFANSWVALGSFAGAAGWVMVSTRALPRWVGWLGVLGGIGLVLSRAIWTTQLWLLPYLFFWIWLIAVSVILLRRASRSAAAPAPR